MKICIIPQNFSTRTVYTMMTRYIYTYIRTYVYMCIVYVCTYICKEIKSYNCFMI